MGVDKDKRENHLLTAAVACHRATSDKRMEPHGNAEPQHKILVGSMTRNVLRSP